MGTGAFDYNFTANNKGVSNYTKRLAFDTNSQPCRLIANIEEPSPISIPVRIGSTGIIDLAYNGSMYVAITSSGINSSPDFITWTTRTASGWATSYMYCTIYQVVYGNGIFVLLGYDSGTSYSCTIWTSSDGITWTKQSTVGGLTKTVGDFAFPNISFANGYFYVSVNIIGVYRSSTALSGSWSSIATLYQFNFGFVEMINGILFWKYCYNGMYVEYPLIYASFSTDNGATWTNLGTNMSGSHAIMYYGGYYYFYNNIYIYQLSTLTGTAILFRTYLYPLYKIWSTGGSNTSIPLYTSILPILNKVIMCHEIYYNSTAYGVETITISDPFSESSFMDKHNIWYTLIRGTVTTAQSSNLTNMRSSVAVRLITQDYIFFQGYTNVGVNMTCMRRKINEYVSL